MSGPVLPALVLDHVGVAAEGPGLPLPALVGDSPSAWKEMPSGVVVARFGPQDVLELVWPKAGNSPVSSFLARRGPGLHHIAFRVRQPIEDVVARLAAAGLELTGSIEPSSDGRPSAFIHPRSTGGVLVELVEGSK